MAVMFARPGTIAAVVALLLTVPMGTARVAVAQQDQFPQVIKIRYEATDARTGGQLIVWVEREKIWYGLDPRLYPAARSVEVTVVTPSPGTPSLTIIAVTTLNGTTPDYFHLSGAVRFRISGMSVRSTNMP